MQRRLAALAAALLASAPAWSCDLCAVYSAAQAEGQARGFFAALSEQFTRYDQLRDHGHRIGDDAGQYLESSVTQLVLGYGFNDDWSLQLAVPYIQRWFKRPEHGAIGTGTEHGVGDLTLTTQFFPYRLQSEKATVEVRVFAGLKLPTGDSERIAEELDEHEPEAGEAPSGIHGHDLALGSGSTDLLFGAGVLGRAGRWLGVADVQYAYRRRGDFDYRFGDDLQWTVGIGRYLLLDDDATLAVQLLGDGDYKRYDDLSGVRLDDTHCGALMVGPRLQWTYEGRYSIDARGVVPVHTFNSEIQTTAGYRVRVAFGYRF